MDASLYSKPFESLYQRILLNYQEWVSPVTSTVTTTTTATGPTTTIGATTPGAIPGSLLDETLSPRWRDPASGEPRYLMIVYDEFARRANSLNGKPKREYSLS